MKNGILLFFLCIWQGLAVAQTTISGKVVDSQNNEPLIGVNIVIKGTAIGTTTDVKGEFKLETKQALPLKLVFSEVGYASQEIDVKEGDQTLQIKLNEEAILGQEVVVSASRV